MKVGDKVQFQIDEETIEDVITFIDDDVIEGEKYDLSHVRFNIIEPKEPCKHENYSIPVRHQSGVQIRKCKQCGKTF